MEWTDGVTECINTASVLILSLLADVERIRISIQ